MNEGLRTSKRFDGFSPKLLMLTLAPLSIFIWQFIITRTLLENPSGSMSLYYYGRGVLALVVACVFLKIKTINEQRWRLVSLPLALAASLAPFALGLFPYNAAIAGMACLIAGAASSWLYLSVFLTYSCMPLRLALTQLFGALTLSYLVRIGLGFVPLGVLPLLGIPLPFACVALSGHKAALLCDTLHSTSPVPQQESPASRGLFRLFVVEFAIFGCVAGLVRTPYESMQFDIPVNALGGLLLAACTAAFAWWVHRLDTDVHLNRICQTALFLLLTVLFTLTLFGSTDSSLAAIVSLFARFGIYTLLLYILCVFVSRRETPACVTFGFGWGFYTLATGLGMTIANVVGISRLSSVVALGIVYALFAVSFFTTARTHGDDLLFASAGSASVKPAEDIGEHIMDDIMDRCRALGEASGLTKREIEVMQLVCLGRSKGYIAENFSITENTVRGYAKNVYRKLGIHSRQELLTRVGIK